MRPEPRATTWDDAEENAAAWMRYLGHPSALVTRSGADAGVDVAADGAFSQVNMRTSKASRPEIQQLLGAVGRNSTADVFFFSFGYTAGALDFSEHNDVGAFTFELGGQLRAETSAARRVLAAAGYEQAAAESPATGVGAAGGPAAARQLIDGSQARQYCSGTYRRNSRGGPRLSASAVCLSGAPDTGLVFDLPAQGAWHRGRHCTAIA